MRAGLKSRAALLVAALAVLLAPSLTLAVGSVIVTVMTYLAVGERRALFTYARALMLFVSVSAAIWMLVYLDFANPSVGDAVAKLIAPGAPFGQLVKMVSASLLIVLAVGSVPDGANLALGRMAGLSPGAAALYAGGKSGISVIQDSFRRSLVALRSHGVVGVGRFSWLVRLPAVLQLTWSSCLHLLVARGEIKWEANGFLSDGASAFQTRFAESRQHDRYCHFCAATVIILVVGGAVWR